jgi:predicted transcriptional regulator
MKVDENKKSNINLELDENLAQGTYSNLALINHSVSEFVVDFINIMPGVPKAKVKSRIILTPQHAKRFSKALNENISRFEKSNGEIKDYDNKKQINLNFGPAAEA